MATGSWLQGCDELTFVVERAAAPDITLGDIARNARASNPSRYRNDRHNVKMRHTSRRQNFGFFPNPGE